MIPEVLDFRITSKCNMYCRFCFGPTVDVCWDLVALREFLGFLKTHGVKYIVLTGGEPTLAPNFSQIVELLKSLGFQIALSTNGTFWANEGLRALVFSYCSWIALPVESTMRHEHNHMRSCAFDHHALIYSILPEIRQMAPHIKIKIGTVVTKANFESVPMILDDLPIFPDIWKLFQLSNSGTNAEYYAHQKISDVAFGKIMNTVKKRYIHTPTKIYASYEKDRNGRYLFLEPTGEIMTIKAGKEYIIGDYKSYSDILVDQIKKSVDGFSVNCNFYNSFGVM